MHNPETAYLLRQAARASDGTIDPLWRIAKQRDLFGKDLKGDGSLTYQQLEAVRLYVQRRLVALRHNAAATLTPYDKLNFQTAYAYFVGANATTNSPKPQ